MPHLKVYLGIYKVNYFVELQVKALGDTKLAAAAAAGADTAALVTSVNAQLNLIINAINGYATPSC